MLFVGGHQVSSILDFHVKPAFQVIELCNFILVNFYDFLHMCYSPVLLLLQIIETVRDVLYFVVLLLDVGGLIGTFLGQ